MEQEHPVRAFRLSLGMTQREFGLAIGSTQTAVSHWELGKRLPRKAAMKILKLAQAKGYQIPAETFLQHPEEAAA